MHWLPRSEGSVRLDLVYREGRTRLAVLEQSGAARVRFPKTGPGEPCEAVLINTAGGLTGGDSLTIAASLGDGASAVLTTAAAEKIYRARQDAVAISVALSVAGNAKLAWLPQPTIVFDRACLERMTRVDLSAGATFLGLEMLIFGRAAMGESVRLHRSLLRCAHAFLIQTAQTALANGRSTMEARLARWLLMADDRIGGGEVPLTHRFLAVMLGVHRPGVTKTVQSLERKGLIRAGRQVITIIDRNGLIKMSDGAYLPPD